MEKLRYFVHLSFKGSRYHGWQIQPNALTVQEVLNDRFSRILNEEIHLSGCGRTDSGVHARSFYAHFDVPAPFDKIKAQRFLYRANRFLPEDIVLHSLHPVGQDSHARFSAVSRTYQYYILLKKDAFMADYAWYYPWKLQPEALKAAAEHLLGYTDFACFSKADSDIKGTDCSMTASGWEEKGDLLIYTVTANRFLRNMVRAIVGTLLEVGRGKTNIEGLGRIMLSGDRSAAGESVPARGLFLTEVRYPEGTFLDF